jgi:hypothetical protein
MGKILDFLFGKSPKIFDKDGKVRHDLGQKKWDNWNKRYHEGAQYNWKNHTGVRGGEPTRKDK